MHRRRSITRAAMALLLTAATLPAASGCARRAQTLSNDQPATETTVSVTATGASSTAAGGSGDSGGGSATSGGSGSSGGSSSSKLTTKDASTLDAELSAIQTELDRLDLPSDSDFDDIGTGLE